MQQQQNLGKAFYNAFKGAQKFFLYDRNGKIHLAATLAVIALAVALSVTNTEWIALLLCIGLVMALEMINAAIERLCDVVQEDFHPAIKFIKDVSAAAVLWASLISAVIACIIFIPKIIQLL